MADGSEPNLGATRHKSSTTIIKVGLTGISPLLMNKIDQDTLEGMVTGEKKAKNAGKLSAIDQCRSKIYHVGDDIKKPMIPSQNLFSSFTEAGRSVRLDGKRQVSTADSSKLAAILTILDGEILLLDQLDNEKAAEWAVDIRKGTNPNGNVAVAICRPRFDSWALRFSIQANLQDYDERIVRDIVTRAGNEIGLCDFRPQRKGTFGRFRIDLWTIDPSQIG
jgi:hypothetical protein